MKTYQASELRTKLILERKLPRFQDDWSEESMVWKRVGVLFAKIKARGGDERFHAEQLKSIQGVHVITRYTGDINARDRLRDPITGTIYQIDAVSNLEMGRRWLEIQATVSNPKV